MTTLQQMSRDALRQYELELTAQHTTLRGHNRKIDMTQGKPSAAQLDLSNGLFNTVTDDSFLGADDEDYRNYGAQSGIRKAKDFFAE